MPYSTSEATSQPLNTQSKSWACAGSASAAFLNSNWPMAMQRTQSSVARTVRFDMGGVGGRGDPALWTV